METIEILLSLVFVLTAVTWYLVYARQHATWEGVLGEYVADRADEMPDIAVSAAESVAPDGGTFRVMVPLANPDHQQTLITLGSAIAKQQGGSVLATHVITVPDQTPLARAREQADDIDETSQALLDRAREDAETFGVPVETNTTVSHQGFEAIFDAARSQNADLVVMGWGPDAHWSPGRAESAVGEVTSDLPCDFLLLRDRGFDPDRILLPTAGGPDSDLSAEVTRLLAREFGSEVSLLYVADEDDDGRAEGETFLEEWASAHGLEDAERIVETGDVESVIGRAAADSTLVVLGATEQGLLRRLVGGSVVMDVVEDVDCSVILAEKKHDRSLFERLFG